MSTPSVAPTGPPRKWYGLALRNLRISHRLLRMGFPDAAFFHCYHAFECGLSALITAKGFRTPPFGGIRRGGRGTYYTSPKGGFQENSTHKAKAMLFQEVATHGKPYYSSYSKLTRHLTVRARNDSLYYDELTNVLPVARYAPHDVHLLSKEVQRFLSQLKSEM